MDGRNVNYGEASGQQLQRVEDIMRIIQEAKFLGEGSKYGQAPAEATIDPDDSEGDLESEIETSGDYIIHF